MILGAGFVQGSLVDSERLRFDFKAKRGMTVEDITKTEGIVNQVIICSSVAQYVALTAVLVLWASVALMDICTSVSLFLCPLSLFLSFSRCASFLIMIRVWCDV